MKSVKVFLFISGWFTGLFSFSQGYKVDFSITDYPDSVAYIGYFFGEQKYVLDTLEVAGDKFTLVSDEPARQGLHFIYSPNYYLEFILDGNSFSLSTSREGGYREMKVSGSKENTGYQEFQNRMIDFQKRQRELVERMKSGNRQDSIQAVADLEKTDAEIAEFRTSLYKRYPGTFLTAFLGLMEKVEVPEFSEVASEKERNLLRYQYYRQHYFDSVDLSDGRLLRTPILHAKVMEYFDRVIPQIPDSINIHLDFLLEEVGDNPESFRYWLVTMFKKYESSNLMGMDEVTIHLIESHYLSGKADWVTPEFEKKLREEVAFVKPNLIGSPAPSLNVVDTTMQPFFVEQVSNPYLVLFFYDPDCGHCKKTTPKLKEAYNELQDLGAEVLAICTVTETEKWKKFIQEYELDWINLADPNYKSNFRVNYNVRTTPKVYVLNDERRIIAKQLDVEQLASFIRDYERMSR